ncbi:hypothetical protein VOLCADRAFT_92974 [Volvox carteri f. nagariensis]|uniref:SCP domain-containing protein n=1 Tax=Volvox carteri f. nagariensis TaxID=3068 RepID=D8U103_VOLCA|nr:uncharacterized protein VOLCADRAFT_92974 [Volvox carteri f. nagariensis]EFJ46549.1 hypothetical protein VOLCADRAFT_92974 [Volvox carteri f. nagariensis]|eukprot:XP_002952406.1 hypothetical protein VOLCADRAFT_92974 [Volvox carteri f. nagariensis]
MLQLGASTVILLFLCLQPLIVFITAAGAQTPEGHQRLPPQHSHRATFQLRALHPLPMHPRQPSGIFSAFAGGMCSDPRDVLTRTNAYRLQHRVPPLMWDVGLAQTAQAWADRLAARGCAQDHDLSVEVGENIFVEQRYPPPDATCAGAVDAWYSERPAFDFSNKDRLYTDNRESGAFHFTQLIWLSSSRLGCGMARATIEVDFGRFKSMGGCKVVVCRYLAPGNTVNDKVFKGNVFDAVPPVAPASAVQQSPSPISSPRRFLR